MIDRPSVMATCGSASRCSTYSSGGQRHDLIERVVWPTGEQLLAMRVMNQMDRGIGERQAARDDEIRGSKTEQGQNDEFAAPTGH